MADLRTWFDALEPITQSVIVAAIVAFIFTLAFAPPSRRR